MNSENSNNSQLNQIEVAKSVTNRKIYNRDDFFRIYSVTEEIPDYLKDFQFLYNNFKEDNWCRKPLPKFSEVPESKGKAVYVNSKLKGRQRTLSNQSEEYTREYHENFNKQRIYTANGKFNRYVSAQNETEANEDLRFDPNNKFINLKDFEDNPEGQWSKVESRTNRLFNATKPYSQNIQVTENHWKKWSKDSNSTTDKINRPQIAPFNRSDKSTNNTWVRKSENDGRQKNTKYYGRHSVSKSGDQTEDIWQDDWDTEMKLEIAGTDELNIESFELPKSSILSSTPPPLPIVEPESQPITSIFEKPSNPITFDHDMWFYIDLSNTERGPFSSESMANWLATGYFNPTTLVRRKCDERFLLLVEYRSLYGRIPFTVGPTIPPIFKNTSIEIEPNQLLIGVENNLRPTVLNLATTLPHTPLNNVMRIDDNVNISPNNVILEEKRLLDQSRAELERERERMLQEQIQWRVSLEAEMEAKINAKIEELMQRKLEANLVQPVKSPIEQNLISEKVVTEPEQSVVMVEEHEEVVDSLPVANECDTTVSVPVENIVEKVTEKWEIDDTEIPAVTNTADNNQWFSTKDIKNQKKNKKMKSKEAKNAKEEKPQTVPIPEAKPPAQPTDTKLTILPRELVAGNTAATSPTVNTPKIKPIINENRKNEPVGNWNATKNVVHSSTSNVVSLAEIQAEESEKSNKEKLSIENESNMSPGVLSVNKMLAKTEKDMSAWSSNSTKSGAIEEPSKEVLKKKEKSNVESVQNDISKSNKTIEKSFTVAQNKNNTSKSFLEIQAEEAIKDKQMKELEKISKNNETETISNPIKTETPVSWKKIPSAVTKTVPFPTKSLLEIQAEESLKEKRNNELKSAAKANEIETNKITSFKDSLLKSTKAPQVPVGKSIWDMLPTDVPSVNKTPVPKPLEPQVKQNVTVKTKIQKETVVTKKETGQDNLTLWCLKKLTKFSDKFELSTVIELLREVPNEEVMEMALQLLDDSKFTSNFVVEFINKRQELVDNDISGDSWQIVKKSVPSPPIVTTPVSNNSKSKSAKSKSKKKMVVIDTKFR